MKEIYHFVKIDNSDVKLKLQIFEKNDTVVLSEIYWDWVNLSNKLEKIGGRRINLPEVISEAVFCLNFNSGRIGQSTRKKINTSFDCFDTR